jgi:D-glycero-alpha-D-manno-heptose-7-phosphate kinase
VLFRARAPLRLGLAGGGTDLSPYCDEHGGAILNATIGLYAYATLEPLQGDSVIFATRDSGEIIEYAADPRGMTGNQLTLHAAVYRRIVNDFLDGRPYPCRLTTYCDAPPGSGLGSSSTLVVAMLQVFAEALALPLGEYDLAHLAFQIERRDVGLQGGRQDQYAATFGGFNFMEFYSNDRVVVNPLRIKSWVLSELEASLVLFFTGVSRSSAAIIAEQTRNIADPSSTRSMAAMHQLKSDAYEMKEAVLKGNIKDFATVLNKSWLAKKQTAENISNSRIELVMNSAAQAGAIAGKVSGAGGGGFITFMVDPLRRSELVRALSDATGSVVPCSFTDRGAEAWRVA